MGVGFQRKKVFENKKAVTAGLAYRTLADTALATFEWWNGLPDERKKQPKAGLDAQKEKIVLKSWHSR